MSADIITSASAIVGGGFFGGLLLGYALKKVVKVVAVIVGLFIAGLVYLQYQQIAAFDWNRIEVMASTTLGTIMAYLSNNHDAAALAMSNFGIPLSAIFAYPAPPLSIFLSEVLQQWGYCYTSSVFSYACSKASR